MKPSDLPADSVPPTESVEPTADSLLSPLLMGRRRPSRADTVPSVHGVVSGELIAIGENGGIPLVTYPGQPGTAAIRAKTVVDLHGPHIGAAVLLVFDEGDPMRPIIMGILRGQVGWPLADKPAEVEIEADGSRMIITAHEQLVLRCGKASITLTKAGKVLIEGSYLLSRSSGVNRVRGGSVQIN